MQHIEKLPSLSPGDQMQLARHKDRPHTADYISLMCESFFELRGDRRYADDRAIKGGLAIFAGETVVIMGHQKGRKTEQGQECNSGMPHPEGYRKAQRLMRHAERFGFPVICLIDTPGAFPSLEAEQRGQAQAIAESLLLMTTLRVPTVAVIIGEGGGEGALALGLADRILMLEHSIYTVVVPETGDTLRWHNTAWEAQIAETPHISASDLLQLGVIDGIVPEPVGGAHLDRAASGCLLAGCLQAILAELVMIPVCNLVALRHTKFRNLRHLSPV